MGPSLKILRAHGAICFCYDFSGDAIIEQFTNATSHFIVLTFLQVCLMCWQLSITFGSRRMAVSFGGLCTKASKVFERMVVVVNG